MTHRHVGEALGHLANAQCEAIAAALADTADHHRSIHEARKAIRRLRSVLGLAVHDIPDRLEPIDAAFKRLGNGLSALRDAHVVVASARKLGAASDPARWEAVARRLTERRDAMLADALRRDPGFARRQARVHALCVAIAGLPWETVDRDGVTHALARTERKVVKARQRFDKHRRPAQLHAWRRRVRRQRMQIEAWRSIDKQAHGHTAPKALSRLSDALGWRQDIQVLRNHARRIADPAVWPTLRDDLRAATKAASDPPDGRGKASHVSRPL